MTDRELLELAAKAANLQIKWDDQNQTYATCNAHGNMFDDWNPLNDDGDAFRLAVKIGIDIGWWLDKNNKPCVVLIYEHIVDLGSDPYAATRRAIVRAAAEIGREK